MTKRPIKFKLDAYRLYAYEKLPPIEAFALAGIGNKCELSGCMTTKAWASGYMSDDIKNSIRKKIAVADPETLAYFAQHKMKLEF